MNFIEITHLCLVEFSTERIQKKRRTVQWKIENPTKIDVFSHSFDIDVYMQYFMIFICRFAIANDPQRV